MIVRVHVSPRKGESSTWLTEFIGGQNLLPEFAANILKDFPYEDEILVRISKDERFIVYNVKRGEGVKLVENGWRAFKYKTYDPNGSRISTTKKNVHHVNAHDVGRGDTCQTLCGRTVDNAFPEDKDEPVTCPRCKALIRHETGPKMVTFKADARLYGIALIRANKAGISLDEYMNGILEKYIKEA